MAKPIKDYVHNRIINAHDSKHDINIRVTYKNWNYTNKINN